MTLPPGTRLLHYEITRKLGEGGMGEVYAARDGKLGRDVALKLLPPNFTSDPERVARFAREARTLASLQHPCVASIYGFEEDCDRRFLVLELAEGEDLTARLARGPVPVEEARAIALRIAEGVEAAHRKQIVHRDLKPANIKIGTGGEVKILDFGLARAALDVPDESEDPEASPTLTAASTQPGTILGTAAYMSPEQARGKAVDERADIWAFGVILFEMLTGRRLFGGETVGDTLAAVIGKEPDWDRLPRATPPAMRRLLRRCLAKDPAQRLQAIGDARLELQEPDELDEPAATAAPTRAWRPHPIWILPLVIGAALGLWLARLATPTPTDAPSGPTHSSIQLPNGWQVGGWGAPIVELSPDGRTVAYVAQRGNAQRLFVRRLDEPTATEVPDSDGAEGPFFSPDGLHVAFGAGDLSRRSSAPPRLLRHSIDRGQTDVVCELSDYFGGVWREDGTIFFVGVMPGPLWRVPASGGQPEPVGGQAQLEAGARRSPFFLPQGLPGGTHVVGIVLEGKFGGTVATLDLESGEIHNLGADAMFARWTGSDELITGLPDGRVFATSFDPHARQLGSDRRQILEDVTRDGYHAPVFAVSGVGDLIYARGRLARTSRDLSRLAWLSEDGALEPLEAFDAAEFTGIALSPDGRRIATTGGFADIQVLDLARGTRLVLPSSGVFLLDDPVWTPEGDGIVLAATSTSGFAGLNLFLVAADGVSPPRQLESRSGEFAPWSFVPGTRRLLHAGYLSGVEHRAGLFEIDLDGGEPRQILDADDDHDLATPTVSPDGSWLAYRSDESGRSEIYLRSFPDLSRKIPIGEGRNPQWGPEGRKLYFAKESSRDRGSIWVRDVSFGGADEEPVVSDARLVSDAPGLGVWRVDPLGRGLLVLKTVEDVDVVDHFEFVQGWGRGRRGE